MASIVPDLIDIATKEWAFFGSGEMKLNGTTIDGKKEYQDGAWQRIGDYWKLIGGGYKNLTGKDRGTPWSAAFVSFCFHKAGAMDRFSYSAGHATFINKAIKAALAGAKDSPIAGQRINEYALKPGDLICYWRGATKVTFDRAPTIGWYESHSDIVVEVGQHIARVIGGNVSHSVTRREVKLDGRGRLTDRSANWFAVVENRM